MTDLREFTVGVFRHEGKRKPSYMAYTRYFNVGWDGCCVHKVIALNGTEAKALAIQSHRDACESVRPRA